MQRLAFATAILAALSACAAPGPGPGAAGPTETGAEPGDSPAPEPSEYRAPCRAGILRWHQDGLFRRLGTNWSLDGAHAWVTPASQGWPVEGFENGKNWGPVNWTELVQFGSLGENESISFWLSGGPPEPRIAAQIDDNRSAPAMAERLRELLRQATTAPSETSDAVIDAMLANETVASVHGDNFDTGPVCFHAYHYVALWPLAVKPDRILAASEANGWSVNMSGTTALVGPWMLLASGTAVEAHGQGSVVRSLKATAFDDFVYRVANMTKPESVAVSLNAWLTTQGAALERQSSTFEEVDEWVCPSPG